MVYRLTIYIMNMNYITKLDVNNLDYSGVREFIKCSFEFHWVEPDGGYYLVDFPYTKDQVDDYLNWTFENYVSDFYKDDTDEYTQSLNHIKNDKKFVSIFNEVYNQYRSEISKIK